ncbi:hypothetical protein pkur_cds_631 [Pandoravirus kuranda]|uniref:Uncharacterized protein n=1 Tax=Pandoravirus kuranda TaxID=3019033 RepID=A0AA95J6T6_9VIRU|nr:hypothetical protein pkur_cds_631 [Pandoravirus kuranda]
MGTVDSLSLADMPAEIIDLVQDHLPRAKDLVSCQVALGADTTYAISRRALATPTTFLAAGAPMCVVRAMLSRNCEAGTRNASPLPVPFPWLIAAVHGDRPEVLAHIHSLASVDHADDITAESWATVGRARWRRLYGEARTLLTEASSGGRMRSLVWLLDFYAASRFASPRPLFNQALMSALCTSAVATGRDADKLLAALHGHVPRRPCSCSPSVAFTCLCLDRPDLVDWMIANGCSAPARIMSAHYRRHLLDYLVSRRAAGSLAWVAARSSQRTVIERVVNNFQENYTLDRCTEMGLLIVEMGAKRTLAIMAAEIVLSIAAQVPRRCLDTVSTWCAEKIARVRPVLLPHNARRASVIGIIFVAFLVVAGTILYGHIVMPT